MGLSWPRLAGPWSTPIVEGDGAEECLVQESCANGTAGITLGTAEEEEAAGFGSFSNGDGMWVPHPDSDQHPDTALLVVDLVASYTPVGKGRVSLERKA